MAVSYRASLVLYIGGLVIFTGTTLTLFSLRNATLAAESTATTLFQQVNAAAAAKTSTYVLRGSAGAVTGLARRERIAHRRQRCAGAAARGTAEGAPEYELAQLQQ